LDDLQHSDGVVARAVLFCRHCGSDPIGPFAGVGDPSKRGGASSAVNPRRVCGVMWRHRFWPLRTSAPDLEPTEQQPATGFPGGDKANLLTSLAEISVQIVSPEVV
jgi:hypothetical protein